MNSTHSGFASINGAIIYYEQLGTGTPIVFVHAGIADSRMWNTQVSALAEQYHVVRYDRRGYGKSKMIEGDYFDRDDLGDLMSQLSLEQAHIVGCSYGGRIALEFALEHPHRVHSLTLVGSVPSGFEFTGAPAPQAVAVDEALERRQIAIACELEMQIWVDGATRTPDQVNADVRNLAYEMNLIALQNEVLELGSDQPIDNVVLRLGEIHLPTLLIWGDLDQPRVQSAGAFMAHHIKHAKKHIITQTAHLPNMEKPDEFNRVLLEFLQAHAPTKV